MLLEGSGLVRVVLLEVSEGGGGYVLLVLLEGSELVRVVEVMFCWCS